MRQYNARLIAVDFTMTEPPVRIPRLYQPDAQHVGQTVALSNDAARHAVKVLRLAIEAPVEIFNGTGDAFTAHLSALQPAQAVIDRALEAAPAPAVDIELIQALSRSAKMDWVVQKATELGATTITPVVTERSVMRLTASKSEKKHAHWQTTAISACEQCGQNRIPTVNPPTTWRDMLTRQRETDALKLLLDPADDGAPSEAAPHKISLLIGPEGGLSDAERQAAIDAGFIPYQLGPRVLRTETAAVAALAVAQLRWGDFSLHA